MNDRHEPEPSCPPPQPNPPPPAAGPPASKRGVRHLRAAIPLVASVVVAAAVGGTVAIVHNQPPPPPEPVAVATEKPDPEPVQVPDPEPDELSAQQLAERYGPAVWKVETSGCGMDASGSAFAIDESTLITNWHVVVTDPTPTLVHRDGTTRLEGTVIGWSDQPDVAVITLDEPVDDWMSFTDASELAEGQTLVGLGYPAPATDFTVTASSILSFQTDGEVRQAIRADGLLDKGNSGGPLLTSDGQVAGVVTELSDNSTGVQLVPLAYTYDHLRATIDRIVDEPAEVEADCGAAGLRPELPEDWEAGQLPTSTGDDYGDDASLDRLWELCADGDWDACDELYWESPVGSGYETFGATCGARDGWWGACATFMPSTSSSGPSSSIPWPHEPDGYGDDPTLDQLWDRCEAGMMAECDQLYWDSPLGSRYESFGATCGDEQGRAAGACTTSTTVETSPTELQTACGAGDWVACDELYWSSPIDSDNETFGATCGNRESWEAGACLDRRG
jgi:hypothetical protein